MLSHSTKTKRRRNAEFYKLVGTIKSTLIDQRQGQLFFLVSLPVSNSKSLHFEARGNADKIAKYRNVLAKCRASVQVHS